MDIEKIEELDYLGEADFKTVKDTTGPISGNIFIKLEGKGYTIMEGDRPYQGSGSVYEKVRIFRERMINNS